VSDGGGRAATRRAGPPTIAVNATILGDGPTGLGLYAANLIRELARLRPGLLVYTSSAAALERAPVVARRVLRAVRPEKGMRGHAMRQLWLQTVLPFRLRRDGAGVLLNAVPEGLLLPVVPQVTVLHDLLPLHYPDEYPRQQHYFRRLVPRVLRLSRFAIVPSESTRREVVELYRVPAAKIRVVPAGYDAGVFHPGERHQREEPAVPYVLFVGNLLPHKNVARLLDAFALVARRVTCRLAIRGAGHAAEEAQIRARVAALGLESRVEFIGYLPPAGLADLYRRARVLVLPSLREGFGLTALEAMACATPVVASNTSSIPEVVGDAALLVDPLDTAALAEAIERILTADALREDLRRRGLARAAGFSWGATASAVWAAIDEV
jgi:glycosyltransferase involved in cell wall biosynthesis